MEFSKIIDSCIEDVDIKLSENIIIEPQPYLRLLKAMEYSIFTGGKRIRPLLTISCSGMVNGDKNAAILLGCAVECIHTASLIHDDMPCMDNSPKRRGKNTCHIEFDDATALLAGTSLYYKALDFLVAAFQQIGNDEMMASAIRDISYYAGATGMMGGQQIDMDYQDKEISREVLEEMEILKTGALIKLACRFGGYTAQNLDNSLITPLTDFANNLGLAYQINDDILDCEGNENELGKPISKDKQNNKYNMATLYGIEVAREKVSNLTNEAIKILDDFPSYSQECNDYKDFLKNLTLALAKRDK